MPGPSIDDVTVGLLVVLGGNGQPDRQLDAGA
jgi:hypothetical protein